MNKKGKLFFWISLGLVVLLIVILFLYFALFRSGCWRCYEEAKKSEVLINPVSGLSDEQAIAQFNESFVLYLLYSIKAYDLHNPPLSSDYPKIEIWVDEQGYNSIIKQGGIAVEKGTMDKKDIIIRTSRAEGVKMLRDRNYIEASFVNGLSGIELVEGKTTLFAKGYLNLYKDLTGKSVTGGVVGIYTE